MKAILKKIPGLVLTVRFFKVLLIPRHRDQWLLRRKKPANLFQPLSLTRFNRHPKIFSFAKAELSHVSCPKLLSFGCSTGEEVFTLRQYFPTAEIRGIDISSRNIAICRSRLGKTKDSAIEFEVTGSPASQPAEHYDAIFCLSVLRHCDLGTRRPEDCTAYLRFQDFEETVAGLARALKPGGYLAIRGSNFRFSDTATSAGFEVALIAESAPRADTPIYGPDNRLILGMAGDGGIFRKLGSA